MGYNAVQMRVYSIKRWRKPRVKCMYYKRLSADLEMTDQAGI